MTQGLLPFQYESEAGEAGLTGLAGLPLYLELWRAAGLEQSVARHVAVSGSQGWSDRQMALRHDLRHDLVGVVETFADPMRVVARRARQGSAFEPLNAPTCRSAWSWRACGSEA